MLALIAQVGESLHAVAHVTGGGIVGNVARILPDGLEATIDMTSFDTPEIFFEIQRRGQVSVAEMVRVFNCGLGMVVAIAPASADAALRTAQEFGTSASIVGAIGRGNAGVVLA